MPIKLAHHPDHENEENHSSTTSVSDRSLDAHHDYGKSSDIASYIFMGVIALLFGGAIVAAIVSTSRNKGEETKK